MKVFLDKILNRRLIHLIENLGNGFNELVIDINLSIGIINSIEYEISENKIYVHKFEENNYDISCDFNLLTEMDRFLIIKFLKAI